MGKLKFRRELTAGTVFRYLKDSSNNFGKGVYYVPPRSMIMPTLVGGEKPLPSSNAKDDTLVKILWSPEAAASRLSKNTNDD